MNRLRTDFLFAQPSWISGIARVLDLFGVFDSYNESRTTAEADSRAMYADWRIVGQDLCDAAIRFQNEPVAKQEDKQLPLFAEHA